MKNARIILSFVALFAIAGGALAFNATKFNGQRAFEFREVYSTFGTVYRTVVSACLPILPTRFITNTGQTPTTVYSTLGTTTTAPIILTQIGGTATITFPAYSCTVIPDTFTTVNN